MKAQLKVRQTVLDLARGAFADAPARPASVVLKLDKGKKTLHSARSDSELVPLIDRLAEVYRDCSARAQAAMRDWVTELPAQLEKAGMDIDPSSRHPKYTFDGGLLTLEVKARELKATVTPREGAAQHLPGDLETVVAAVGDERARLLERDYDPVVFLDQLFSAYGQLIQPGAESVKIRDLGAKFQETQGAPKVKLDEFLVDLGKLASDSRIADAPVTMKLNHVKDQSGVLVYGLESGGLVGTITMREDGEHARGDAASSG